MSKSAIVKQINTAAPAENVRSNLKVTHPCALTAIGIEKSYRKGNIKIPVLKGINLNIREGEFTAIVGKSGSGKSTLLHLLGTLDAPDSGEIWFGDQRVDRMTTRQRDQLRNSSIGMIFQFFHLLPELTTLENVMVPRMIEQSVFGYWRNKKRYTERACSLLEQLGLGHRLSHRPSQLSGGEMQRVAIARALVSEPTLLLADEPTGNLDSQNGSEIMDAILKLKREEELTIVMVTHDERIAERADHVVRLVEGRVDGV